MSEEPRNFDLTFNIGVDHRNPVECITGDIVEALDGLYIQSLIDTSERLIKLTVTGDNLGKAKSAMDDLGMDFVSEEQVA